MYFGMKSRLICTDYEIEAILVTHSPSRVSGPSDGVLWLRVSEPNEETHRWQALERMLQCDDRATRAKISVYFIQYPGRFLRVHNKILK